MRILACLALCSLLSACGGGSQTTPVDAVALPDLAGLGSFPDVPPGCPPGVANDIGVGKTCTKGGKQCPSGQLCTCDGALGVDPPKGTPCFCTRAWFTPTCPANWSCGENATCCSLYSVVSGCVPNICLTDNECPVLAH